MVIWGGVEEAGSDGNMGWEEEAGSESWEINTSNGRWNGVGGGGWELW